MPRFPWKICGGLLALLLFAVFFIWPIIDRQLMEIPVTNGITALRNGNVSKLAQSFTPDAIMTGTRKSMPISLLLDRLQPRIAEASQNASLRFGGYSHLQRHGDTVTVDVTLIDDYSNDDLPYRSIPLRWTESMTLVKQGLFTWKIKAICLHDDVGALIEAK